MWTRITIRFSHELGCFGGQFCARRALLNVAIDGYWAALALPLSPNSLTKPGCVNALRMPAPFADLRNRNMTIGTVKFFNADKGYGFIAPEDGGSDAFVHISAVERAGMRTLNKDQRVSYELETDRRGKTSAVNLAAA